MSEWAGLTPPYRTIVADPPWPIDWHFAGYANRPALYSTMGLDDIAALTVGSLAADDAELFLWITPQLNRRAVGVETAEAWGFTVRDEIIWHKPNMGAGRFPRHCHEMLLVCRRGDGGLRSNLPLDVRSVQTWRQDYGAGKTHSAKPAGALDLVERVADGPYLELFARRQRLGWDSWGHGYETAAVS